MNTTEAHDLVAAALTRIVPDADVAGLPEDAPLRRELELDSLDFLAFVEHLSELAGVRIDEDDYAALTSPKSCADFLLTHTRRTA